MKIKKISTNSYILILVFLMILNIVLFSVSFILKKIEYLRWFIGSIPGDEFGDFLNIANYLRTIKISEVYETPNMPTSSYPPMAILIIALFSFPGFIFPTYNTAISLSIFLIFSILLIGLTSFKMLRKYYNNFESTIIVIFLYTSCPFVFLIARGNILILVIGLLLSFIYLYNNNNNKFLRELGCLLLALATAIKIYPIVFYALVLKNKDYKIFLRCIFYVIFLFFIPFFFTGGFSSVSLFIYNIRYASSHFAKDALISRPSTLLNFLNISNIICSFFGVPFSVTSKYYIYFLILVIAFLMIYVLLEQNKYKVCLSLCLICIFIPSYSWYYTGCLLFIPVLIFFCEISKDKIINKINVFWLLYFSLFFLNFNWINALIPFFKVKSPDFVFNGYLFMICEITFILICFAKNFLYIKQILLNKKM